MTDNGQIPRWYELSSPTPLVERGGQWYHDDVPVQPVEVLAIDPISSKGGRRKFLLQVAMPDGSTRRVFGQEVENFSGVFALGTQPVLCQVSESSEPSVGSELSHILMPMKREAPKLPAPHPTLGPQTPPPPPSKNAEREEVQVLNRADELVCWAVAQAVQSAGAPCVFWDEAQILTRSRSLLRMHQCLRHEGFEPSVGCDPCEGCGA